MGLLLHMRRHVRRVCAPICSPNEPIHVQNLAATLYHCRRPCCATHCNKCAWHAPFLGELAHCKGVCVKPPFWVSLLTARICVCQAPLPRAHPPLLRPLIGKTHTAGTLAVCTHWKDARCRNWSTPPSRMMARFTSGGKLGGSGCGRPRAHRDGGVCVQGTRGSAALMACRARKRRALFKTGGCGMQR